MEMQILLPPHQYTAVFCTPDSIVVRYPAVSMQAKSVYQSTEVLRPYLCQLQAIQLQQIERYDNLLPGMKPILFLQRRVRNLTDYGIKQAYLIWRLYANDYIAHDDFDLFSMSEQLSDSENLMAVLDHYPAYRTLVMNIDRQRILLNLQNYLCRTILFAQLSLLRKFQIIEQYPAYQDKTGSSAIKSWIKSHCLPLEEQHQSFCAPETFAEKIQHYENMLDHNSMLMSRFAKEVGQRLGSYWIKLYYETSIKKRAISHLLIWRANNYKALQMPRACSNLLFEQSAYVQELQKYPEDISDLLHIEKARLLLNYHHLFLRELITTYKSLEAKFEVIHDPQYSQHGEKIMIPIGRKSTKPVKKSVEVSIHKPAKPRSQYGSCH